MEDLKHIKKTLTRGMLVVQKVSWDDAGWDLFVLFFLAAGRISTAKP